MANTYNATYKRFNGIDWDTFYFATTASQVAESSTRKWLSADQQSTIVSLLMGSFNAPGKLAKVDNITGHLPLGVIPELAYLPLVGGILTGDLNMSGNNITDINSLQTNTILKRGSAAAQLLFSGFSEIDANSVRIINVADPVAGQDAANKSYVDMVSTQGSHLIGAVKAASTGNIPTLSGLLTIDGVTLSAGDRILVKNQTTTSENGVYIVSDGAWTKLSNDSDKGSLVSVLEGTTQQRNQWYNQDGTAWVLYWVDDDYGIIANGGLEVDGTGLKFGIANDGVTTARILNGAVTNAKIESLLHSKISSWSSAVAAGISNPATSKTLDSHFQNVYKMVQLIKGTSNPHDTLNDNLIAIRSDVDLKNRSFIGTAAPSTSGFTSGDLYFHHT